MSVWQTLLVFVVIPAAIYGLIALATTGGKSNRAPRYRSGQQWNFQPVWWSGNPAGVNAGHAHVSTHDELVESLDSGPTARGGASGGW